MNDMAKQDRLEQVLADGEQILNRVNARLDNIDARQNKIEEAMKAIEGLTYLIEWKEAKEGVK
ncbi:hypothetical protein ACIQZD_13715 [Peribacillus sp. NPDC096447]|uniref:hypothetical protein n=1 Tax=Peribacillus sp. NPDC096447 TaxID=3364394 RepID=UPI003822399E